MAQVVPVDVDKDDAAVGDDDDNDDVPVDDDPTWCVLVSWKCGNRWRGLSLWMWEV